MKKTILFPLFVLAALCAGSSCSKPEEENNDQPSETTDRITLSDATQSSIDFSEVNASKEVSFSSSGSWTAGLVNDRAASWCSVSPASGPAGTGSVKIEVKSNDSSDDRSASVIIKTGKASQLIRVSQKCAESLTLTASSFQIGSQGGEINVEAKSNVSVSYEIDPACASWVTYGSTKAISTKTFTFHVAENDAMAKREGTIRITSSSLTETVKIYQEGSTPTIVVSKSEVSLSQQGGQFDVEVRSNIDVEVSVDASWIREQSTKAMSTNKYVFVADANEGDESRSASIKFSNAGTGLCETVSVTQMQKDALVVSPSSVTVGCEEEIFSFEVVSNIDFTTTIEGDWISAYEGTKATVTKTLYFKAAANGDSDGRSGRIVFAKADGSISQTVEVIQTAADWSNIPNDEVWYKTSYNCKAELIGASMFDVDILSNTYENGRGILKLSGAPTIVKADAFLQGVNTAYLTTITTLALPSTLKTIEDRGFYNLQGLKQLVLAEGLETIGEMAFAQCFALESITLPSTVREIGYLAFGYTPVKHFYGDCDFIILDGQAITHDYDYTDPVTGINHSGRWLSAVSSEAVDVVLPDGLSAIDNCAFAECANLETLYIPSSVKYVGGENFKSKKFRHIGGPYASADNRCYVSYGELQVFAPAGLKSYTTPSSLTSIGMTVFCDCDLEEININDEVTTIGMYAFKNCQNLKTVTLPSSLETMSYDPFYMTTSLENLYVRSIVPPGLSSAIYTVDFPNLQIHVPEESLELYRNSASWEPYRKYLVGKHYEDLTNPTYYYSTDFSSDGTVHTLQHATAGNGIDIVIMGDAFSDRQIADGTYASWMEKAMEAFFNVEPYKTYRHLFNVYSVDVVSSTEGYEHGLGALETRFGQGTFITGNSETIKTYAAKAVATSEFDKLTVMVIPNKDVYAGTCTMFRPEKEEGYAQGLSIGWIPASANDETFSTTLNHEIGGHGFGKLVDEYYYAGTRPSAYDIENYTADKNNIGWWINFDFTPSRTDVSWAGFLSDSRYDAEGLGVFEGANFQYGAYRPRETSIMRYNVGGYNAPSREIIYKRIMSLAYGPSWTYDFEEFCSYDQINLTPTKSAASRKRVPAPFKSEKDFVPLAPPVVVGR